MARWSDAGRPLSGGPGGRRDCGAHVAQDRYGGRPDPGFCAGATAAVALAILTMFAGGPLGDGRLSVVGPSPWQTGLVAVLELGISAAVAAGVANWRSVRNRWLTERASASAGWERAERRPVFDRDDPHVIFVDRWAAEGREAGQDEARAGRAVGPSALPRRRSGVGHSGG